MPSFLKDLRRMSRSSFRTEKSSEGHSSGSEDSHNTNQSSSTVDTGLEPPTPPDGSVASGKRPATSNGLSVPARRPSAQPLPNNRYSIANVSQLTLASAATSRYQTTASPYAPRILSISDNSWVNQKVLLVFGQIADPAQQSVEGQVCIQHHQDSFPSTSWPVTDSFFKALVHLQPGPNRLRFDFVSPKFPSGNGAPAHTSSFTINYLPLNCSPPLELAILLAKDSPGTYDAVPERKEREGNGLDMAIKKFKMAAYLWQAFTGEQMNRNGFGRRCFRFEEEWQPGTLSSRDASTEQMRNEAKIHVIRCDHTVEELRDAELAQQNKTGSRTGDLFTIAGDAVKKYFNLQPGQKRYVTVLLLDAHWDAGAKLIRGHAALGGGDGSLQLAIFGSQALHTYPSSIEEVVPAFTDCTRTDTNHVANDCNESGSNWEAANIGIGAHMHEVGHLFGSPHQKNGVMARDYTIFNRTFLCREPYVTRTKSPGKRLCLPETDECSWHRLDALRFRYHPCFATPADNPNPSDPSVQVWAVDNGNVLVTAACGVAWIEVRAEGDDICHAHIEYLDKSSISRPPPCQVVLAESDIRNALPPSLAKAKKLSLEIFTAGGGKHEVPDFSKLTSKTCRVKLPSGRTAFKGSQLGFSQLEGSQPEQILFRTSNKRQLLTSIKVYHGYAVDGIEFLYEDQSSQLMGKRGGTSGGSEFVLDTRRGEMVLGFYVRAGLWIDGIQIITTLGRRSEVFGNPTGGSAHTLIPPRGFNIVGISGTCGVWMDGFALLIAR